MVHILWPRIPLLRIHPQIYLHERRTHTETVVWIFFFFFAALVTITNSQRSLNRLSLNKSKCIRAMQYSTTIGGKMRYEVFCVGQCETISECGLTAKSKLQNSEHCVL